MSNIKNLADQRFGKLTAIECVGTDKHSKAIWSCSCACGNIVEVISAHLSSGHTKSCGCIRGPVIYHGYANSPMYFVYRNMKSRCYNHSDINFKNYGGRGISVCDEWLNNPKTFFEWCIENNWAKHLQIDRENNDKNYTPDNCRFVTRCQNAQNQRLLSVNNTSGYAGVFYRKDRDSYVAIIKHNKRKYYIKTCKTAVAAAIYRDLFIIENKMDRKLNFCIPR